MDNKISFNGSIKLTKFEQGFKKVSKYATTRENDQIIKDSASKIFKYYTPNYYKTITQAENTTFREIISKLIGEDLTKKNYFDTSVVSYSPSNVVLKDLNRHSRDGIELDIKF